jgi:hypothetical protein
MYKGSRNKGIRSKGVGTDSPMLNIDTHDNIRKRES